MFEDEDEDEMDSPGRQKVELREGSISLDQVCLRPICVCYSSQCPLTGQTHRNAKRMEERPSLIILQILSILPVLTLFSLAVDV
jgi:hypothetical protein